MRFLGFLVLIVGVVYIITNGKPAAAPAATTDGRQVSESKIRRGVSLAGPEFGTDNPGFSNLNRGAFRRDYTFNSERLVRSFCSHEVRLFRIPIRWERMQPVLGGELDAAELKRLKRFVRWASENRGEVIIDLHNYGRYALDRGMGPHIWIIDQSVAGDMPVTRQHLAQFWTKISQAFRDDSAVYAYGLMNEPHDMGQSDWKAISQHVVDAIRGDGDRKLLLVAGNGWSDASRFEEMNGSKDWISDSAANIAYEAHCYFDHDRSGRYARSYEQELRDDQNLESRPIERLRPFVDWCRANNVRGFVGEFGVPVKDSRWTRLLERFIGELNQHGLEGCYWGAGDWWGDYQLAIHPNANSSADAQVLSLLRSR